MAQTTTEFRQALDIPDEADTLVLVDNAQASREWVRAHPNADEVEGLSEDAISEFEALVEAWLDARDAAVIRGTLGLDVVHIPEHMISQWFAARSGAPWAVSWDHTDELSDWLTEALAHTPDATYPGLG